MVTLMSNVAILRVYLASRRSTKDSAAIARTKCAILDKTAGAHAATRGGVILNNFLVIFTANVRYRQRIMNSGQTHARFVGV